MSTFTQVVCNSTTKMYQKTKV